LFAVFLLAYAHGATFDTTKHFVSVCLALSCFAYGFSTLPSAHIILEFGCELGDPTPPASCNTMMILLANLCSIVGVFF